MDNIENRVKELQTNIMNSIEELEDYVSYLNRTNPKGVGFYQEYLKMCKHKANFIHSLERLCDKIKGD